MENQVIAQLRSQDASQRKQAIIAAGNAKNPNALPALNYLSQNDPVPELRTLAAKAAQYIAQHAASPVQPAAAPPTGDPQTYVNRAVDLRIAGNDAGAAAELRNALALDPALVNDPYTRQLASAVTGLDADAALAKLGANPVGAAPASGGARQAAVQSSRSSVAGPVWTCRFCGTTGIHGDTCPNCGAARDAESAVALQALPSATNPEALKLSEVFLLDPDHQAFVTGKTKKLTFSMGSMMSGCTALFMIPFVLAGIFIIYLAAHEWQNFQQLSLNGQTASATVVDHHTSTSTDSDGNKSTTYYVGYHFLVDGRQFSGSQSLSWSDYDRMAPGTTISIIYSRSNPNLSAIGNHTDNTSAIWLSVFAAIWNGFVWLMLLAALNQILRVSTLQSAGRMMKGTLTACKGYTANVRMSSRSRGTSISVGGFSVGSGNRYDSVRNYNIAVNYTFENPKGKVINGMGRAVRNDLDDSCLPQAGTLVVVLYANDSTYQML